ncbi:MAG: N-acetylmuramoyl-L-alanine amidase [Eubacteriales bacterium]|nr:N-acetylmuramoyl-L-alanine amidase [Eubacteriales bacterium]
MRKHLHFKINKALCFAFILAVAFSFANCNQTNASQTQQNIESNKEKTDELKSKNGYSDGAEIGLSSKWKYSEFSEINSGKAKMYLAKSNRKNKIIGINAGHGTNGGSSVKTYCHPDKTAKLTGGTTSKGSTKAVAVSSGMTFKDGIKESDITLKAAQLLKDSLLANGYDVLMLRDGDDVQLDNVARTVICNNVADCHIALHWDGDGLDYDKGCFYMSVPDGLKYLDTVKASWKQSEALGECLINGLADSGMKIWKSRSLDMDLTQTSYSYIPSVDIELGNQCSDHSEKQLKKQVEGLVKGINSFYGFE